MWTPEGRTFQAEETTSEKALSWECVWLAHGIVRIVWLRVSEGTVGVAEGRAEKGQIVGVRALAFIIGCVIPGCGLKPQEDRNMT